MSEVKEGQSFISHDGVIEVKVVRVGNVKEKARFRLNILKGGKGSYTISVKRKSGAEADRIVFKTDELWPQEHELSPDETIGVDIRRDP